MFEFEDSEVVITSNNRIVNRQQAIRISFQKAINKMMAREQQKTMEDKIIFEALDNLALPGNKDI